MTDPQRSRPVDRIDVAPAATPTGAKPPSIRTLERLIFGMAALMVVGMLWNLGQAQRDIAASGTVMDKGTILLVQGGFILFSLGIGLLATRRRSVWARRLMKVVAVLMIANPVLNAAAISAAGGWLFALAFAAAGAGILVLMNRPDAKAWFAAPATPAGDGTPSASSILRSEIEKRL